jgi:DNA-binding SARP family transcriptional activator
MLAALALARHRTLTRARLAGLLWSASDTEQARDSVRQALAQLRRAGVALLTPDVDSVALPGEMSVDVEAFMAAQARGNAADAIRLYRGDLMEGQGFRDAVIEGWLDGERTRLREHAIDALVSELDRIGDKPQAADYAHRLLALDPLRETAHRTLIRLDAARGEPSAALARYNALRDLLRRELATVPEEATTALIQSIRTGRRLPSRSSTNPVPPLPKTADVHLRQVVVLAALASDDTANDDWSKSLATEIEAAGGDVLSRDEGQLIAIWGMTRTRAGDTALAVSAARAALGRIGTAASLGLAENTILIADGVYSVTQVSNRAIRLAARAVPGALEVEPGLAERLSRPERPTFAIVGREAELAQVLGAARAALSELRGLVIHLGGEAGIGKSRLAQEVADSLSAEEVPIAWVQFDSFGRAQHPGQMIAAALPLCPALPVGDPYDNAVLGALLQRDLSAGDQLRLEALAPDARLRRDLRMTEGLIANTARTKGLLLVIEDCHWASEASASFVLQLAEAAARLPVIMLLTERGSDAGLGPRLAAGGKVPLVRVSLAPLSPTAAARLARTVGADPGRVEVALSRAGGHPLFLLRLLESDFAGNGLPATISHLVQEQIERLSGQDCAALRQASILGRRFAPTDFETIFGRPPPVPTGDLLVADGKLHAFGHDLIHLAVYESMPEEVRRSLHSRAAVHYRTVDPLRWADHALLSDDAVDTSRAAAAAASSLINARRFRAAMPYIEGGLAAAGDADAVAELHACRATLRRIQGDLRGALQDYRAAYASAVQQQTRVAALTRMALVLYRLDRSTEAEQALDDAEAIADRAGIAGVVRAEIHEQRGNLAFSRGDHEACALHHAAALAIAKPTGDMRMIARAHGGMGDAAAAAGRMRTAVAHFDRATSIARAGGCDVVIEEFGYIHAFACHLAEPGPHATALADLAVDGAVASGAARTEAIARLVRSHIRLSARDLTGAGEDLDCMARLLDGIEEQRSSDHLEAMRALLAYRRGDLDTAVALVRPSIEGGSLSPRTAGLRLGIAALAGSPALRSLAIEAGFGPARRSWLAQGVLWFHRLTLESALLHREVDLARTQIAALLEFTAPERLGWVDLVIENADLHLSPDDVRAHAFADRAEAAGIRDLPPLPVLARTGAKVVP